MTQLHPHLTSSLNLRRYIIFFGVPLVAVLGVVLFGTPMFEGNDDTGLAMVGAGFGLAVDPDPHLVFAHFGYGLLLNAVSRFAGPHAHGWTTLAALGLSMALYSRALCGHLRAPAYWVGAALIIVGGCVFVRALLEAQFTITAALLFGAAIGCWLSTQQDGHRSTALLIAIYGAIILSFMIRPASALLGLVVIGPALIWLGWLGPAAGRKPARNLIAAVAVVALIAYVTDKAGYAFSPEWRDAIEYNQLRSLFNDFFRIPWIAGAPEYEKVGWSANDYAIFLNWYSLHPIFDYDNIKFLAQSLVQKTPWLVLSGLPDWLTAPWDQPILGCLVAVQLVLCLLLPRHRVFVTLVLMGALCAIVLSALSGRPPQFRVWFAIASVAVLCTLPLLFTAESGLRLFQKFGVGLLVGIAIFVGSTAIRGHQERVANAATYRAALSEMKPFFSGTVISWGASLMWEWLITPTNVHPPLAGMTIPSIGLFTKMPVMRSTLRRLGIADLGLTLCTQPDVRLIANTEFVGQIQTFCEEHYNIRPAYTFVFSHTRTLIYVSGPPERAQ